MQIPGRWGMLQDHGKDHLREDKNGICFLWYRKSGRRYFRLDTDGHVRYRTHGVVGLRRRKQGGGREVASKSETEKWNFAFSSVLLDKFLDFSQRSIKIVLQKVCLKIQKAGLLKKI